MQNLPIQRKSQFDINNDDVNIRPEIELKRMKVRLPDLTQSIDPRSPDFSKIIEGLVEFDRDRGGLAVNSVAMLASVLRTWDQYCHDRGGYAFPVTEKFALGWLRYERYENNKSVETIRQYKAQLTYLIKWLEMPNPLESRAILAFMKSLVKDQAEISKKSYRQKQAFAMRGKDVLSIIEVIDVEVPLNLRNIALASCAYTTMLRESELGRIRLQDVQILPDKQVVIHRTHSKTSSDVESKTMIGLFADVFRLYLNKVRDQLNDEDFIFSQMHQSGKMISPSTPMTGQTVDRCLGKMYDFAVSNNIKFQAINPSRWTGHSGRVGGCQDSFLHGMTDAMLMQLGDWKDSSMVQRYTRELNHTNTANAINQSQLLREHEAQEER